MSRKAEWLQLVMDLDSGWYSKKELEEITGRKRHTIAGVFKNVGIVGELQLIDGAFRPELFYNIDRSAKAKIKSYME